MSNGVIIFSRMSSKRLPGKALLDIEGRSMIGRVLDRCLQVECAEQVILATSDHSSDDALAEFAEQENISLFRGSLDDVAQRALDCAKQFGLDRFARVCGDRPFMDASIVDQLFEMHASSNLDLATNVQKKTYPAGLTGEIVSVEALCRLLSKTDDPQDHEHVTRYMYQHPDSFAIKNSESSKYYDNRISLVVDTQQDLDKARYISANTDTPELLTIDTVISLAKQWYSENKGYVFS